MTNLFQKFIKNGVEITMPVIPEVNTKTFYLSGTSDLTTAQAVLDYYNEDNNPVIYYADKVYTISYVWNDHIDFIENKVEHTTSSGDTIISQGKITINFSSSTVSSVVISSEDIATVKKQFVVVSQLPEVAQADEDKVYILGPTGDGNDKYEEWVVTSQPGGHFESASTIEHDFVEFSSSENPVWNANHTITNKYVGINNLSYSGEGGYIDDSDGSQKDVAFQYMTMPYIWTIDDTPYMGGIPIICQYGASGSFDVYYSDSPLTWVESAQKTRTKIGERSLIAGDRVTISNDVISADKQFEVVNTLPSIAQASEDKVYILGPIGTGDDKYEEWIVVDHGESHFESATSITHEEIDNTYDGESAIWEDDFTGNPIYIGINNFQIDTNKYIYITDNGSSCYCCQVDNNTAMPWIGNGTDCDSTEGYEIPGIYYEYETPQGCTTSFDLYYSHSPLTWVAGGKEWIKIGETSVDLSNYVTTTALNTALATKQDILTAGTGIDITNNTISVTKQFAVVSTLPNPMQGDKNKIYFVGPIGGGADKYEEWILTPSGVMGWESIGTITEKTAEISQSSSSTTVVIRNGSYSVNHYYGYTYTPINSRQFSGVSRTIGGDGWIASADGSRILQTVMQPKLTDVSNAVESTAPLKWTELYQWTKVGETSIDLSNYLAKDNTTAYTPSGDYNPATKKYVDDSVNTYTAGTGLTLSGTEFSADTTVLATKADIANLGGFTVVDTLPSVSSADEKTIYLLGPIGTGADKYEEWIITEEASGAFESASPVTKITWDWETHDTMSSRWETYWWGTEYRNKYVGVCRFVNNTGAGNPTLDIFNQSDSYIIAENLTNSDMPYTYTVGALEEPDFVIEATAFCEGTLDIYFSDSELTWNPNVGGKVWTKIGETSVDLSGYATTSALTSGLATKQNTLTTGTGIDITNDVISVDDTVIATQTDLSNGLATKQDTLTAGNNITISQLCESDMQGPAPDGFHIPSKDEWDALGSILYSTFSLRTAEFALRDYLKIPLAGFRGMTNGSATGQSYGYYWTSTASDSYEAFCLSAGSGSVETTDIARSNAASIRCFKNTPVVPDNSWTTLYDGSSIATGAGIFYNATDGLISVSGDGQTWYTIQDKNLGATEVFNGGTVTDANSGYFYQWGNNYGFAHSGDVTTSPTQVDASNYGPGNYYSSSTFITRSYEDTNWDWSNTLNDNLWGGVSQGTQCQNTISATDTTYLAGTGIGIDANNQISNTLPGPVVSATAPSNPSEGDTWYDTTNDIFKTYDGTDWNVTSDFPGMTILSYGHNTWQDFLDAYNRNAIVYCRASSNSNPGTGVQGRMAFMAYIGFSGTTPTNVEFQYYRSRSDHNSQANELDEVYVYKLENTNGGKWTVTQRNTAAKTVAGTGISLGWGSGNMTVTNSLPFNPGNTGTTGQVIKKTASGYEWANESGGGSSYTAGDGIDITNDVISVDTTTIQPKLTAGTNISIANDGTISATDTTYNAGEGIEIKNGPDYSAMQGPAPDGFHVPLNTERQAVKDIWTALGGGGSDGTNFGIALKLPFTGFRFNSSSNVGNQGDNGRYWSSTRDGENSAYYLYFNTSLVDPQYHIYRACGFTVRGFKNSPVVPTSSWTKLYGTSIEAGGIFWSSADGLISLSSDGNTWVTIADKNLGATTVWNSGDTLSEANCGKYYQRGNNYGFPRTGTISDTSSTQVDASAYGPGNYYSSSTFITRSENPYRWDTTDNGNLRGGETGVVTLDNAIINTGVLSVNGQAGNITIQGLPSGGTVGQVLMMTADGPAWVTLS